MIQCSVKECPYRGKCDLEMRDADACAVYRVTRPERKKQLSEKAYRMRVSARILDKRKPIEGVG